MGKRYRRYRSNRNSQGPNPIALLILLACCFLYRHWKIIIIAALVIVGGLLIWYFIYRNKNKETTDSIDAPKSASTNTVDVPESHHQIYSSKASIMTESERAFFEVFKKLVEPRYTVQPQINLASVIDKESRGRYRNELFRNIDFGIFDRDYKLLVLIEINDHSHTLNNRKERDQKVKMICEEANIPLITFWTKYGINEIYIRNRLSDYLILSNDDVLRDKLGQQNNP